MYHEVVPIKIKPDSAEEPCVFMIWPITVLHVIDEESPFFKSNASDMAKDRFELHVVLEGVTESTSMTFQARTSYLPHEILWGHRFESMMIYRRDNNKYQGDKECKTGLALRFLIQIFDLLIICSLAVS